MRRLQFPLIAVALLAALAAVSPASAQGRALCNKDTESGVTVTFGVSIGKPSRQTQEQIWRMKIEQLGVDVRSVKRTWDGCLAAYVRMPDGSFNTQYYDEDTLVLVQE